MSQTGADFHNSAADGAQPEKPPDGTAHAYYYKYKLYERGICL